MQIPITARFLRSTITCAAMAFCKYSTLVGGNCGPSSENPANVECITIGQCKKEVNGHLTFCKVSDDVGVDSESKLLLARAGRVFCIVVLTKPRLKLKKAPKFRYVGCVYILCYLLLNLIVLYACTTVFARTRIYL